MFSSLLTNPFIAGIIAGSIIVGLSYIDSKIRSIEREREIYIKLFCSSSLVFALLIYFISFSNNDEFLNQTYCTEVPDCIPNNKFKVTQKKLKKVGGNAVDQMNKFLKKKYSGNSVDINIETI